ncbi:serine protease [Hyalangium sp.]|uniref:MXAN_2756 family trypsin-like serine endoprotease n=1 Tax=Hyalangium sp. TaxID=2028555 RepID=UPI002D50ABE2|nr:serine protease [Hyalangium sp.]HYI00996.1 serine protease [Hyalangium sp.]
MTPRLLALLLLCLGLTARADGAERPTRADLQKAVELHERSVVRVLAPRRSGPGVIVGSGGQVLTAVDHVSLETTEVEFGGKRLPASVVLANAYLKVAVIAAPSGTYPSVPVKVLPEGLDGQWLIGVIRGRGKKAPAQPFAAVARLAKQEPFLDVGIPFMPGTPLFDTQGRLVAVVVQRRTGGCRALPLSAVKLQLASAAEAP